MTAPPACLDECTNPALVAALTSRGFDVVSLLVVGPRGIDDEMVLERTTQLGRVLVTHNTDDFQRWDRAFRQQGRAHGGIICLPQRGSFERLVLRAAMMLDWVGTRTYASRLFVWGELQQQLERGAQVPRYGYDEVRLAIGRTG